MCEGTRPGGSASSRPHPAPAGVSWGTSCLLGSSSSFPVWGSGGAGPAGGQGPHWAVCAPFIAGLGGLPAPRRPPQGEGGWRGARAPRWSRTPRPGEVPAFLRRLRGEPGAARGGDAAPVCQSVGRPGGTPAPRPLVSSPGTGIPSWHRSRLWARARDPSQTVLPPRVGAFPGLG